MTGGISRARCPVCRQKTLSVVAPTQATPPMLVVVDGESRRVTTTLCGTCTSVWFFHGNVDRIDWDAIDRGATEHDDRGS